MAFTYRKFINRKFSGLINSIANAIYTAYATAFDANSDYLSRAGLTGVVDGKTGILSVYEKLGAAGTTCRIYGSSDLSCMLQRLSSNTVRFEVYGTASQAIMMTTTATISDANFHHIMVAWDTATAGNNKIYIDGVDAGVTINQRNDVVCDYTLGGWNVNASTTGSWTGSISELFFAPNQWLDLTNSANILKFRGADGKPVSLGSDGSTPTGTAPAVYLKNDYATFGTNSGTGGDFTVNGTLASDTAP